MEYLIIVGFVAVIIIPMMVIFYTYAETTSDQIVTSQVNKISLKMVDIAESVYYLGEPSKTKIKAYFPKNIKNVTVGNYEIVFSVHTSAGIDQIVVYSPVNVSGSLNEHSGIHNIVIQSRGTYVEITG